MGKDENTSSTLDDYPAQLPREIVEHIGEVFWLTDAAKRRVLYISPAYADIWGRPTEELLAQPQTWMDAIHPEDRERVRRAAFDRQEFGDYAQEYRILRPDGSQRWILDRAFPIRDAAGESVVRIAGIAQDITRQKQVALLNAVSRQVLEMVANDRPLDQVLERLTHEIEQITPNMMASILLLNTDGVHVRLGAAPSLPMAYTHAIEGEPIGPCAGSCGTAAWRKEPVIVTDIASDPLWADYRDIALEAGLRACWSIPILDHTHQVLGTFAMYYGEPHAPDETHRALIEHVTSLAAVAIERTRARTAIRESRNRLELFIEHAPAALAMFDRQMRYLGASRRWRRDYGLGECELEGLSHYEVFPEISDEWKQVHRRGLAGETIISDEELFLRADGGKQWLRWEVRPWRGDDDAVEGIVIFTEDISERREAQEALRQLNAELEQRVERRTAELTAANNQLLELDRLKSLFIASVSHELRTPLNAIVGFSGLLAEGRSGPLNDKQHDQLSRVYRAARHLLALISDIIDVSRLESGHLEPEVSEFTLGELLQQAADQVRPQCQEKELTLQVSVPDGVLVTSDYRRLLQCLLNYLSNAVKFTEEGLIELSGRVVDGNVELSVTDNGPGIADADRDQLFEAFSPLSARRPDVPGTGLGLYLTKRIAERVLGGEVGMQASTGSGGSRFWLRVPADIASRDSGTVGCAS